MMLYRFDKKLRMLIFNEIEKVEVAIRATIVNTICELTGDKFWMTKLYLTRNDCAHHARVWNKRNTMNPTIPNRMTRPWITLSTDPLNVYHDICIIKYLLDVVSPNNDMLAKLRWLFVDFPEIDLAAMGFPKGWEMEPIWQ